MLSSVLASVLAACGLCLCTIENGRPSQCNCAATECGSFTFTPPPVVVNTDAGTPDGGAKP